MAAVRATESLHLVLCAHRQSRSRAEHGCRLAPFIGSPGTRLGLSSVAIGPDWYVFGGRVELPPDLAPDWKTVGAVPSSGFVQAATSGVGGTLVHSDAYRYNLVRNEWTR